MKGQEQRDFGVANRNAALKKARMFAESGNTYMVQHYVWQANNWWPVTKRQITNLQKILSEVHRKSDESVKKFERSRHLV